MKNYQAILFHPEGDFVTDFRNCEDKKEVWTALENMGSRWIFYPIAFVATQKRIVDAPEGLEFLNGKSINTVSNFLATQWKERADKICEAINDGVPYYFIY